MQCLYHYIDEIIQFLCQKNISSLPQHPRTNRGGGKKFVLSTIEKKNYIEFDFRLGTILVIFSIL